MNVELTETFIELRKTLTDEIETQLDILITDIWDPIIKYKIIYEVSLFVKNLPELFPDFPPEYFPQCTFRLLQDDYPYLTSEVQQYINIDNDLIFLGNDSSYDYYIKELPSSRFDLLIAKYGHSQNCMFCGSKEAVSDYHNGEITPLSKAYSLALDDGFIK